MDRKEHNLWLEKFNREIGFKSSIVLTGNTIDIVFNKKNAGQYDSFVDTIASNLKANEYQNIIRWDRIDGVEYIEGSFDENQSSSCNSDDTGSEYDLGDSDLNFAADENDGPKYKEPDEFFPFMFSVIKGNNQNKKNAFIIDYSDYIFGNANSLSEKERNYLAILGKTLEKCQSYDLLDSNNFKSGSVVIIIAKNSAMIPPAYYLNNPLVSLINVPMPGRVEREMFIDVNMTALKISENIMSNSMEKEDFIDSLDGFTLKEIAQIIKLSRQYDEKTLSYKNLINLFKYGEKVSPWEELSQEKLKTIRTRLKERVKGQDEAIRKIEEVIIRAYTGFSGLQHSAKQKKPKGTLFFVGPTGVGKTELAKALAEFIFGDENACIRFDMSEYNHEHSDQRLVGAPPGYVGYEAGGQLTNAIKEKPFCVLLFDEIEKAHGKILDKFLQILEDGRLTDGKGETVSFSESIIIFTSNIGAAQVSCNMGKYEAQKEFVRKVKEHFIETLGRPELLNRIGDNIVAFNFIDDPEIFKQIAKVKFKLIEDFVKEKYKASLEFDDEDKAFMCIARKAGKQNGGRGLLNVMETDIVSPLAKFIFDREGIVTGRKIQLKLFDNGSNAIFDVGFSD